MGPHAIDESRLEEIKGNPPFFALLVMLAWTTIAFGEEMSYRAFLITRMLDVSAIGHSLLNTTRFTLLFLGAT